MSLEPCRETFTPKEKDGKISLRLLIYQPQAHWRVPFAYQRRHTLALPPFSTIIGLLCNVLGIRNLHGDGAPCQCDRCRQIWLKPETRDTTPKPADDINAVLYHELVNQLELSVAGTFASKTTEYTWFRNLNAKQHTSRFGSPTNRIIDFTAEHPGGQIPVSIDILNDVHLIIHIGSSANCLRFLKLIKYAICNDGRLEDVTSVLDKTEGCGQCGICQMTDGLKQQLEKQERLYPLHLGRAEDWVVFEDVRVVELGNKKASGRTGLFHWIPKTATKGHGAGLLYRVATFYSLNNGRRLFHFVNCFLNDGKINSRHWAAWYDDLTSCKAPSVQTFLERLDSLTTSNTRQLLRKFFPVFLTKTAF